MEEGHSSAENEIGIDEAPPPLPTTNLDDDYDGERSFGRETELAQRPVGLPSFPARRGSYLTSDVGLRSSAFTRRGSNLTNDALHLIRDRVDSVSVIETDASFQLWRMVWPFLLGGSVGMLILLVPLSAGGPKNRHTNFWVHIVVQNGSWLFLSIVNFEMVFHAAFSQLGEEGCTLPMPRAWIWISAWLAYLLVMLVGKDGGYTVDSTDAITPMVPAALVMLFYAVAARMLIQKGSTSTRDNGGVESNIDTDDRGSMQSDRGSMHRGSMIQTDADAATFGLRGIGGQQRQQFRASDSGDNALPLSLKVAVIQQYVLTVVFVFVGMGIYLTLEAFAAAYFAAQSKQKLLVFTAFCGANIFIKQVYTTIGRKLDMGKRGSVSLFYAAEMMCALFYFSFYRLLFEALEGYGMFVALQFIHACTEWLTYPCTATDYWVNIVERLPDWARFFLEAVHGASKRERACYITNAFGVRVMTFIYTSIAFVAYHAFVVLGWNSKEFGRQSNDRDDLWKLSLFVFLAAVVECLNAWLMNVTFFAPNKLDLLVFMSSLFKHGRPYEFQAFVAVLANILLLQLFLPFVSLDFGDSAGKGTTMMAAIIGVVSVCLVVISGGVLKSIFESEAVERHLEQKEKASVSTNVKSDAAAPPCHSGTTASPLH